MNSNPPADARQESLSSVADVLMHADAANKMRVPACGMPPRAGRHRAQVVASNTIQSLGGEVSPFG